MGVRVTRLVEPHLTSDPTTLPKGGNLSTLWSPLRGLIRPTRGRVTVHVH